MMTEDWDGAERRAAVLAASRAQAANGKNVEVPIVVLIVGFAAVVLLQLTSLFGHSVMSGNMHDHETETEAARDQIACFIVGITQGKQGPDLLTQCGFLQVGSGGK